MTVGDAGPDTDATAPTPTAIRPLAWYQGLGFRALLGLMLVSLGIWAGAVGPANKVLQAWAQTQVVPADWTVWRDRWQYGQAGCFVFDTLGYCALLASVLRGDAPGSLPPQRPA